MNLCWWLNTAWMQKCRPEWTAFRRASRRPAAAQWRVLRGILRANQRSEFGRRYAFAAIRTSAEYQRRVPISDYRDYTRPVERIAAGEQNVLTTEPVRLLEPTSGTTSGQKLIPYTRTLQRQYQRMIAAWIFDLFSNRPAVRRGRAYWSISPAAEERRYTTAGIPIGFDDDTAYLGGLERRMMARLMAVPSEVARLTDIGEFQYATLLWLLRGDDLALISIWSPTFLSALLERVDAWGERLCADLRTGQIRPPSPARRLGPPLPRFRPNPARASAVESILRSSGGWREALPQLWPPLALISCWADASAGMYAQELQGMFPAAELQPKGLLATEGCVSFPLTGRPGAALALRSHFFEFEETSDGSLADAPREVRFADELELGRRYGVILTTGGGLYRYRLGDVIEVVGFENRCPLVRFCGRPETSDLVGEKLTEAQVRAVLERAFALVGIRPRFALVAPVPASPPHYRLYLQLQPADAELQSSLPALAERLQTGLEENPHYRYAVRVGQLAAIELRELDPQAECGWRVYERHALASGRKLGDIKPTVLDQGAKWSGELERLAVLQAPGQGLTTTAQ